MKTLLSSSCLVAALCLLPAAFAKNSDAAPHLLAANRALVVTSVGPYVGLGTCRIQVSAKLGRPAAILPDGTWLYDHFAANRGDIEGTLVVRFANGRVHSLSLAGPAVIAALRARPQVQDDRILIAAWNLR